MTKRQFNVRVNELTRQQIDRLAEMYRMTSGEVITQAVDRFYREEQPMNNRVAQVNWIEELAANIAQNMGEGTPEELVEYALSEEARYSWNIELPDWFDDHDRRLLVATVEKYLNS